MEYDRIALISELQADEGLRLKPYECTAGKTTIGIGRNLDDVGISKEEAYYLLGNDIDRCEKQLDQYLGWWRTLSDQRQRAMINLCFQLGIGGLLGFPKMLGALQAGNWGEAYRQALDSKWAKVDTPERAQKVASMFL